jgi:tetratricopeptide (TPR) repeat protein
MIIHPHRLSSRWLVFLCWLTLAASIVFSDEMSQLKEQDAETLLRQAEAYYQKGEYKLAVGCYLEAVAIAQNPLDLSLVYFGLALNHFYLQDMASSVKWMRKTSEVDPNKEISDMFYPRNFVQLFKQIQKEVRETRSVSKSGPEPIKKPDQEKIEEGAKPAKEKTEQTEREEPPPPPLKQRPSESISKIEEATASEEEKGGHWEASSHYSVWTINLIKGLFEGSLTRELGEEIQNKVVKKVGSLHAGLVKSTYAQNLAFSSGGSNYGLEVRYYSKGQSGTFSLGLSLEQTHIKFTLKGPVKQEFTNGSSASVNTDAYLETNPFSVNFSFRWEFGAATSRVKPYFVLGFGFASLSGTFYYSYTGSYQYGTLQEEIPDSDSKSFEELSEDINFNIPKMLVILQLHFGIKVEIYKGLSLLGEAGIWDGFLLRAGVAYRF